MTLRNKTTKSKNNLWLISDICLLLGALLIYGCSSEQKKVTSWDEINYAKVGCSDTARGKDCASSNDIDVTAMTRGGKR